MQEVSGDFVQSELKPHAGWIEVGGRRYHVDITADPPVLQEENLESGGCYPLKWVLGGKNVYYFLTPWERGRWQMLPLAFDARGEAWFDAAGSMLRHFAENPDEPHHWTDREFTFNTSCYRCHVSQLAKNYDLETDTYHTTWKEPGINCDTCHGPGAEHARLLASAGEVTLTDLKIISYRDLNTVQSNATCAPCHAKIVPLTDRFGPGESFFDHYDLVTLEDRDFHPDGRDLGENYTYTLWRISPCAQNGEFACTHCHTSSGRNRHVGSDADRACLPCHEQEVAHAAAHSFHPPESEGARCVACHMQRTTFARMVRHDHSMLPPTPAATLEFGSPNACNLCHADQDAKWADDWVRKWYKDDYQEPLLQRARLVAAARKGDWSKVPETLAYVRNPAGNEIFRTSLIRLLEGYGGAEKWPVIRHVLKDPSPLVRAAAARSLVNDPTPAATNALLPLTGDRFRLVRISAAFGLSSHQIGRLPAAGRAKVEYVFAEYEAAQRAVPDSAASHYNLGVFYQHRGMPRAAADAYEAALRLRSDFLPALLNSALVYARLGKLNEAQQSLERFLRHEPEHAEGNFNIGLLLAQKGHRPEAETALRKALKARPEFAAAAYNLAVLRGETDLDEAIALCRRAAKLQPDDPRYGYTLAFYLQQRGARAEAIAELESVLQKHPHYREARVLLNSLQAEDKD